MSNFQFSNRNNIYNNRQKEAITHDEGPVLVVSGAGTGKTHLLTGRIIHLIQEKNIDPQAMLALTFTEKATQEMTDRVEEALPLGHPEIWIKTFHGFCESILRERGFEIGLDTDFKILSEVDLWMFLRRKFLDFKFDYYRPLGNPYKFLRAIQQHFSRLQDEDILPEKYIEYAQKTLKQAKTEESKETAEKHFELARAYQTYQDLLKKEGLMDFGGLLFSTLRLFEKRKSVLREYQERFKYILVDEFQDTNFAQNKIVILLAQKHRNLLVVGDDDQSIYKWRGASLTNTTYFSKLFPEADRIALDENYRNSKAILDMAYGVIQKNNPRRLEVTESISKRLKPVTNKSVKLPELHHFGTIDEETDFVISRARETLKQGKNTAILVRTNALSKPFLEKLKFSKTPYQHFSSFALFSKPGVKDCIALLRVVANPWDDTALFRLLNNTHVWDIKALSALAAAQKAKSSSTSIFENMGEEPLRKIKQHIEDLAEYSRDHIVSEVLVKFFKESNYLDKIKNTDEGFETASDIALFSDKIRNFENANENKSVADFLTYAEFLEETGGFDVENPSLDPACVKILTVHAAKGLEFDAVFIPGLVAGKFPATSRREPFEIPPELIEEPLTSGDHHLEEERRLFYVAVTRARENLFLSYSDFYDGKKQWKPSTFISESLESGKLLNKSGKSASSKKSRVEKNNKADSKNQTALPFSSAPKTTFEITRLSYSQINDFERCPLKYKYRYVLRLPAPTPPALNFGTSIHNTLRDFYLSLKKEPTLIKKDLKPLLKDLFEKNWVPTGIGGKALEKDQKRRGLKMLERFYEQEKSQFKIPCFIEQKFKIELENFTISGRIDRIDKLEDSSFEVIDYKTGSSKDDKLTKNLQLSIYALACRDYLKIPVSKLSLYFLEDGKKVSTERNDLQINTTKEELIKYAREMSQSEMPAKPGYQCSFCEYKLACPHAMV